MNKQGINSAPKIIALQMCSGLNPDENIAKLKQALQNLPTARPLLVCLPEAFLVFSKHAGDTLLVSQRIEQYKQQLSELCRKHNIWLNTK